jgi:hypothetical protein
VWRDKKFASALAQGHALEVMLQICEPFLSTWPVNSMYLATSSGPTVLHLQAATSGLSTHASATSCLSRSPRHASQAHTHTQQGLI